MWFRTEENYVLVCLPYYRIIKLLGNQEAALYATTFTYGRIEYVASLVAGGKTVVFSYVALTVPLPVPGSFVSI